LSYFQHSDELPSWVGTPPDGWRTDWLKWRVSLSTERPTEEEAERLPYIANEDISSWTGKLLRPDPQPADADSRKFRPNDVLFNKLRPYLAKIYHTPFAGVSSGELLCLRPNAGVLPRYLFYVVSSKAFVDAVNAETFGSKMPRADWETVGHQPLPLPTMEAQRRIAAFLDDKTARIDALIEKKRALLERLAEKRQAIITQAVTKGLNPAAPMKDSGIDWLGQIPAHWEVKRLKFLVMDRIGLQMGPFGGMLTDLSPDPTGYKLYGQENTISGDFQLGRRWIEKERFDDLARYQLHPGDLVITRKGSLGSCRRFPAQALPGIADSDTIAIRFDDRKLQSELAIVLLHDAAYIAAQIESTRRGAILAGLNTTVVGDLWIVCPKMDEQSQIVSWFQSFVAKIDSLTDAVSTSIAKTAEYRSALITAAVTGQIGELK
jgi:type I restriction enzyme S subunit